MKRSLGIALAGATIIGLSACGAAEPPQSRTTTEPAAEQPVSEDMAVEEADDEGIPDMGIEGARDVTDGVATFAFGDDAAFPGGQGLKISYVEETTLSEYGAGDCVNGDPVSVFKVTVKNDTGTMWEPYLDLMVAGSYTDDESGEVVEASDVFDDWNGESLDAGQSLTRLPNGSSGSSYWGFCHAGGSADSVNLYGSFFDEYGDPAGDTLWVSAESGEFN